MTAGVALVGMCANGGDKVYVFEQHEGGTDNWGQSGTLSSASRAVRGDLLPSFGHSVAVSLTGSLPSLFLNVMVGANLGQAANREGVVHLNTRALFGTTWSYEGTLSATNATDARMFGVRLAAYGSRAIIGAGPADLSGDEGFGSAYLYRKDGDTWVKLSRFRPSASSQPHAAGTAVAVYSDTAIVGAPDTASMAGVAYAVSADAIHQDGFESGDTSDWTVAAP